MLTLLRASGIRSSSYLCRSILKATFSTIPQRRFYPSQLDHVEDLEEYRPGGLHPVAVGDTFASGRYQVLHKLGFGGTSTIWLTRDQHPSARGKLMTLKVMSAEQSTTPNNVLEMTIPRRLCEILHANGTSVRPNIRVIEDSFMQEGPNGSHLCLVSEFAGPSVHSMLDCPGRVTGSRRLRSDLARNVAKQVAAVIQLMHSEGYVHGDLTTSNVLFRVADHVHQWSDDYIYAILGEPDTERMATLDGSPLGPHAPVEVVAPIDNASLSSSSFLKEDVIVSDFGQSFAMDCLPEDYEPATVVHYASPEARFESRISLASDIWALACTIFEIRAGFPLFESFLGDEAEVLKQMVQMLGKLPGPWWTAFDEHQLWFESNGEPKPLHVQKGAGVSLPAIRSSIRGVLQNIGEQDKLGDVRQGAMFERAGTRLKEDEIQMLGDLLERMLRYRAEDRVTIQDVVCHPWFCMAES